MSDGPGVASHDARRQYSELVADQARAAVHTIRRGPSKHLSGYGYAESPETPSQSPGTWEFQDTNRSLGCRTITPRATRRKYQAFWPRRQEKLVLWLSVHRDPLVAERPPPRVPLSCTSAGRGNSQGGEPWQQPGNSIVTATMRVDQRHCRWLNEDVLLDGWMRWMQGHRPHDLMCRSGRWHSTLLASEVRAGRT